ncbi:MAG: family 78 glycoside hydrolase catalytic domain [Lewinella sp.]|nr:family 78 glycoside hydrolase catalytic domain [Lewinella sp.]
MRKIFLLLLLCTTICSAQQPADLCRPVQLSCEYLINPLGVDSPYPRLRWKIQDERPGAIQQAYRIWVGTDSVSVAQGVGNRWNPGKMKSHDQWLRYQGTALDPFTTYFWSVEVWDKDGVKSEPATPARFETGMITKSNWRGAWITDTRDEDLKPAPYFRKSFTSKGHIKSARVYVAVAGLYELYLNGQRVGDHQLDPMYTRFDRRNLYVTYDVTSLLEDGKNAIGVLLGNGWYNHQSTAVWYFHQAPWRARPKFCLDLRLTYEDGSEEVVYSDRDWKTTLSPVVFNSIYTAEHYDARQEISGWDQPDFDDTKWKNAELTPAPSQHMVSQVMHPIRHTAEITPKSVRKVNDRHYIFDLGRNIAGVTRLQVSGEAGAIVRVTHAEVLGKDGLLDLSNIDLHYRPTDDSDPFQTDIYTLSGNGEEVFMPRFNYKGFQYVAVESDRPLQLDKNSLTGMVMHSDVPPVGNITSSNPTLNKIWEAANSSYLANLFGYPTDCPQREKNGWTGDAHIASETGLYNFDGITIYEKWLADHRDEQQANGILPAIIPTSGWGYQWANGPDWTSTIAIIPWNIYLFYGDNSLLSACYYNIRDYVDHITDISSGDLTDWGLGDWVPVKSKSPVEFTSSLYYYVDVSILAEAARLFGKTEDQKKYQALADQIAQALNDKYLDRSTGIYGSGLQTELSAALHWGIVPAELREKVAARLAERVEADKQHIDVGLLGTKTILNALSENGYADLAYRVASRSAFPSWGWWIVNGATTLSENWDLEAGSDISRNHIMFGEISAWYYKALGGIKPDPAMPGFKHILLEPHFVVGLDQFEASHDGPYGTILSSWQRNGEVITYRVTIPPNSQASWRVKAREVIKEGQSFAEDAADATATELIIPLEAGTHVFSIR